MPIDYATGGQSTDCSVFGSTGPEPVPDQQSQKGSYSTTALDGTPVTFTLTIVANGQKKDKYFDWQATGATVFDVGIKGGSETARYAYTTPIELERRHERARCRVRRRGRPPDARQPGQALQPQQRHVLLRHRPCPFRDGLRRRQQQRRQEHGRRRDPGPHGPPLQRLIRDAGSDGDDRRGGRHWFSATRSPSVSRSASGVCLVAAPGRTQTLPTSSTSNKATCDPTTPGPNERALGYGASNLNESVSGLDFGEAPVVALSGTVFSDANDNGQKNAGEAGARRPDCAAVCSRLVRSEPGDRRKRRLQLREPDRRCGLPDLPRGRLRLRPDAADGRYDGFRGVHDAIRPTSGPAVTASRRPRIERASTSARWGSSTVSGAVFDDANDSGSRNTGESGIAGRTVRLYSVSRCPRRRT